MRSKLDDWRYGEVGAANPNDAHAYALELVGHNKRVLELGCTAGHVTKALVRQGCRVIGVEIDPEAALQARESADDVINADLSDLTWVDKLEAGHFDAVLAGDVLEHLTEPLTVLKACRPLLKPDGVVVVSFPNIAHADVRLSLLQGKFEYRPWGLLDDSHVHFFTIKSAAEMLRDAGFVPTDLRRVIVPVFESEVAVSRQSVREEVLESVLEDPEAETYQMVFRASLDNGDTSVLALAERCRQLEDDLRLEVRAQAVAVARAAQELEAVETDRVKALKKAEADRLRAEKAEELLERVQHTRTFRYLAPLRRVYGSLRRR